MNVVGNELPNKTQAIVAASPFAVFSILSAAASKLAAPSVAW